MATHGPALPLALALFIIFLTLVPGGGYLCMKIWFYFLNSRFRKRSAPVRDRLSQQATLQNEKNRAVFVGFFHPYWCDLCEHTCLRSNAGGGGERVLWTAIKTMQTRFPEVISVVYTGDIEVTTSVIFDNIQVCSIVMFLTTAPLQYHYQPQYNSYRLSPPTGLDLRFPVPKFHNAPPISGLSHPSL